MTEFEALVQSYRLVYVNTKDIKVDPEGQRDVERRRNQFTKIMNNFNINLVQPITLAKIDGEYLCIDGQMTRKVLIAKNDGQHLNVPCRVIEDCKTKGEAADLFVKQRGCVKPVSNGEKFNVGSNYGSEVENGEIYQAIDRIVQSEGMEVCRNKAKRINGITAITSLVSEYNAFGKDEDGFAQMIRIIKKAWNGDPDGSQGKILRGLGLFVRTYKDRFNEQLLIRHLSKTSPNTIIRNADVDTNKGYLKYAFQIWLVYNKGTTSGKLPNLFN